MGKSKSVEKLLAESKKNQEKLKEIEADLELEMGNSVEFLNEEAENFYKQNNWTYKNYLNGAQFDFQTTSTWSLNNLSEIINKIAESVIGTVTGKVEVPEGTSVDDDVTDINEEGGITKDRRLLIASNTFNLLSGLVRSFGSTSTIQIKSANNTIPIGQGLRIFAKVSTKVTKEKSFFNDNTMCSYIFSYKVAYSLDEFSQEAEQALVSQLQADLDALHIASEENLKQYKNKEIDIKQYFATSTELKNYTKEVQNQINEIKKGKDRLLFLEEQMAIEKKYLADFDLISKEENKLLYNNIDTYNFLEKLYKEEIILLK